MVKRDLIKQVILLVSLLLGLIALRAWVFEPVTIQPEMANAYLKEKDLIITVRGADATYGDFILYEVDKKEYVGRIIAMEGDSVTYMDDVLYRNNEIVHEDYLSRLPHVEYYTEDFTIASLTEQAHQVLPEGTYLVLNDDRTNLSDSRTFGLIDTKQVIGRLTFRLTPLSDFGFIDTGVTQQ
ncbi:signal peptidase I [Streptococcus oriscaviae]|uniref:Signal peptidase I n=1 Tax=Streptococcus oriscaviae TaxID=2781599 RepID=A0ABX7YMJ0_9STRE|nr:signal peptidase I [Streptococcus oriscaviae]QUE55045.1 signal peptidase I [Streptococcus oriscaviae]